LTAAEETAKLQGAKRFKLSKKDLLLSGKVKSSEVEGILKEVPNPNIILNGLSSLRKGEATYFKFTDINDGYIVIAIIDVEKSNNPTKEFSDVISRYIEQGSASDITDIAMKSFRSQLSIDVDEKLIAKVVKTSEQDEDNK
jgi:hypothetical protein